MATIPPDELLRLWSRKTITSEMTIGHLIQNLVQQQATIAGIQSTLSTLRSDVERTIIQPPVTLEQNTKDKRRPHKET
jgi:hypothetical protein